jgi:hypothetical protein
VRVVRAVEEPLGRPRRGFSGWAPGSPATAAGSGLATAAGSVAASEADGGGAGAAAGADAAAMGLVDRRVVVVSWGVLIGAACSLL